VRHILVEDRDVPTFGRTNGTTDRGYAMPPQETKGRFVVQAESRHPRIGRDYSTSTHSYTSSYVNPSGYGITIDAFPGKILIKHKGDTQVPPGGDPKQAKDVWKLLGPLGTVGWEFSISGRPFSKIPIGPKPPLFSATQTTKLPTMIGQFNEASDRNAWNCRFVVPGPGVYDISVRTLIKGAGSTPRTHRVVLRDFLVVSIGDSAASGEGSPDIPGEPAGFEPDLAWWEVLVVPLAVFELTKEALDWLKNQVVKNMTTITRALDFTLDMDPEPVWLEEEAHRSLLSGHGRAARLLEDRDVGTVVTYLGFGRSGATIEAGLVGVGRGKDDKWINNISEIEETFRTVGGKQIDALLIHVGINDVGITGTLTQLLRGDNAIIGISKDNVNRELVKRRAREALDRLPARFEKLATELARLNVREVYLVEYPGGAFDGTDKKPKAGCGVFDSMFDVDMTHRDAELVQEINTALNAALAKIAAAHGWNFVGGIEAASRGHGYCVADTFFIGAEESLGFQGDTEGTIHPNAKLHSLIAKAIASAVKKHTIDAPEPGSTHGGGGGKVQLPTEKVGGKVAKAGASTGRGGTQAPKATTAKAGTTTGSR
jgi:hypothetical protein